jgi:enoyl-CoA hydratase
MREEYALDNQARHTPVTPYTGFRQAGAEGRMAREQEIYLGFCERWRNLPKPTIAQVQGRCIAGGLCLVWPMDIIIASEDASFTDMTVALGIAGVEYFVHTFEVGTRKAKEMLYTGKPLSAREAQSLGMVNQVVPADQLEESTLALAATIARQSSFGLKMAKMACNAAEDAQGRQPAMNTAFALHHLAHSHWMEVSGMPADASGVHQSVSKHYESEDLPWNKKNRDQA